MSNNCVPYNIKWEDRGILLGLIYFILKKYKKLKYEDIYIHDDKYRAILSYLFPECDFTNVTRKNQFNISIKSIEYGNLNINNLNNLESIKVKKYYILPWYDKDNPLVMFTKGKKNKNIHKIKDKIDVMSCHRGKPHGYDNYISYNSFNTWDTQLEFSILNYYCQKFGADISFIYNLINEYLLADINPKKNIQYYPVEVPTYIPYEVTRYVTSDNSTGNNINGNIGNSTGNNINSNIKTITTTNKESGDTTINNINNKDIGQYGLFMDLIKKITNNLSIMNNIIDVNMK